MSDQDLHNNYAELISRYLSGNASDLEVQELETWVLASPDHKAQFIAFKKAWILSGMEQNAPAVNVAEWWNKTSAELFDETAIVALPKRRNQRWWLQIAAALVALVAVALWMIWSPGNQKALQIVAADEVKNIDLPDGSNIHLNQASSIHYTTTGPDAQRKVVLEGDAFFDVARDEAHPFIVHAQEIEIEVLGTSFYVDSRPGQAEIQVIVQTGTVAVRYDSSEVILQANEKAVLKKGSGELIKQANEDPNYLSIKTKALTFDSSSLEAVVFALNRHFKADISLAIADVENCKISATYEDKPLEAILLIIEKTLGIQSRREGSKIILTGEACR